MWNLLTSRGAVCVEPGGVRAEPKPLALLPGSFNPLHRGHTTLAAVVAVRLGVPVHFELSITNADKPELPPEEVKRRVAQFAGIAPVWITQAPTFEAKSRLFPGAVFVLGWDTAVRVIDPKYYGGPIERDAALRHLRDLGCRIVIGGRLDAAGTFRVWDRAVVSEEFTELFIALTEADFRVDVSSRVLRLKGEPAA